MFILLACCFTASIFLLTGYVIAKIQHHYSHKNPFTKIHQKLNTIMATQAELLQALTDIAAQLQKATDEIIAATAAAGNTSPEIDAALANLQAVSQALDALNPDAPVV